MGVNPSGFGGKIAGTTVWCYVICKHKFVSEEIISVIANPNDIWIRFVSL